MGEKRKYVVSDPSVMMGKPVITGTRITVELILEKLAAGETVDQIVESHPRLSQSRKAELLSSTIRERAPEIPNAFSVVTPGTIRIRHKL